jgi:hypothetical protein
MRSVDRCARTVPRPRCAHDGSDLTGRGLTTRPMTVDGATVSTVDLDLVDHRLDLSTSDGGRWSFPLTGRSVAAFHDELFDGLATLGIEVDVADPRPFDLPDADRPFALDTEHATYVRAPTGPGRPGPAGTSIASPAPAGSAGACRDDRRRRPTLLGDGGRRAVGDLEWRGRREEDR